MSKYTIVNQGTCKACGACSLIAPDIYEPDRKGFAFGALDHNQGTVEIPNIFFEAISEACEKCPTNSIKVANLPFFRPPVKCH